MLAMTQKPFMIDVRQMEPLGRSHGGRRCSVCSLDEKIRHRVNLQILKGQSYRDIAGQFQLAKSAIHRHVVAHLWPEIQRMLEENSDIVGGNLLDAETLIHDLGAARQRALDISERDGVETRDQLGGLKVAHSISRTGLELAGKLKAGPQVAVQVDARQVHQQIEPTINAIMTALADHPEAQLAVAEALDRQQNTIELQPEPRRIAGE